MGIFQSMIEVVNRAPWPIKVQFDGQTITLPPGENHIPDIALQYALNQNPMNGTADLDNPHVSGAQYLIGIPKKANKYPCEPLTAAQIQAQKDNPCRFDYMPLIEQKTGGDPKSRVIVTGRKKTSQFEARQAVTFEPEMGNIGDL